MVDIKIRRLGWACHIIIEERIPKKVFNGKFHNTRPVGRPRTRWVDVVQRDALQMLGYEDGGEELKIEMNGGIFF